MHFLSGKHTYRFLHDASKVYMPADSHCTPHVRFFTSPYHRVPQGIVLYASLFPEDCVDVCRSSTECHASVLPISLTAAKCVSSKMSVPLLVTVGAQCDVETKEVQYEFFLYQPVDKFFGRKKKEC